MTLPPDLGYLHRLPCYRFSTEGCHAAVSADNSVLERHPGIYGGRHRACEAGPDDCDARQ